MHKIALLFAMIDVQWYPLDSNMTEGKMGRLVTE
jgi:hypothetical protein